MNLKFKSKFLTILAIAVIFSAGFLGTANLAQAEVIKGIEVSGNERVEVSTVMSYLRLKKGDNYSPRNSSQLIKVLYRTGLFENVELTWQKNVLSIVVKENPLVNKVVFEGNKKIDSSRMEAITHLKSRHVYTPDKVQKDVREILAYYQASGRFLTKVKPQIIRRDQNRVDVIYGIKEGKKTKIRTINFIGNSRFQDDELKMIVRSAENRWWKFMTSTDVFDENMMEFDKELLRRHYIAHGYADFKVMSAVSELAKDKSGFYITFTLSEGNKYNFGRVDIKLDAVKDEGIDKNELFEVVKIQTGETYNGSIVEKDIDALIDYFGNKGYAFLDVKPTFKQDEITKIVAVTYHVVPGPRVYVNRINIRGNQHTKEHVIRREMRFSEGDSFSTNKLSRSKDRLGMLGFFEKVDINRKETGKHDKIDIDVKVHEQSTGEFNIGAGFSSYDGALANADIKERNFLGNGQELAVGFTVSKRRQNFNVSFTEPYFLDQDLRAGVDLFKEATDFQDESSFDTDRRGGALRFGFPINEVTRNTVRVGLKETTIENVSTDASIFVQETAGTHDSITLTNTFAIDTRDSRMTPTKGYRFSLTAEVSGFGTNTEYLKGIVSASTHNELAQDWVLSIGGKVGVIDDLGKDLPLFENFKLGVNNLRGFDFSGIGPRDRVTEDALGGKFMLTNSIELTAPLGNTMKEMGINGLLFVDGGIVSDFKDHADVIESNKYRISVGTGIYWRSPLGPLRFEFGFPLVEAEEDRTRIFNFSFGTRF